MPSSSHPAERTLPAGLEPLVRQLAALPIDERQQVIQAAEREAAKAPTSATAHEERRARWQRLRSLAGVVNIGGNALEDCERSSWFSHER